MNFAPYQWRADGGYLPPPDSMPAPAPLFVYPGQQGYPFTFNYPPPPPYPGYGPVVPVSKPVPAKSVTKSMAPPKVDKSIAELKSVAPGESSCGSSSHSLTKAKNVDAPPSLRAGMNYMYAKEHTILQVFNKSSKGIWEGKYEGIKLDFKIFKVDTNFMVKTVIERVVKGKPEGWKGWAVTEVVERGDGVWSKGTTIEYDSDKAKGNLKGMGWGAKRGNELPPVWLVVHKL